MTAALKAPGFWLCAVAIAVGAYAAHTHDFVLGLLGITIALTAVSVEIRSAH